MATISFSTSFDLTLSPKQFVFEDTSDYAGQSILVADVNGSLKITSPSGTVIYNNTDYSNSGCDIRIAVSTTNQTVIQLPLGLDGFPEPGIYTIIYTVYNSDTLEYYTITNTYTYAYVRPEVTIQQITDCISPLFTSIDTTNYAVNGITPTIDRVHTIDYPFGSAGEGNPTIGTAATITTSTFYNGTQTTEIESDLEYEFSDGLIVIDYVTGVQEVLVDCTSTCAIYCCVRSIEQQMMQAATTNSSTYPTLTSLFSQIMGLVGMVSLARTCNKSADISGYLDAIKLLAHCTDDCDCSGDTPTQVMGLGGLVNQVIVDSAGAPITVTPVTVGNTTTYTISFDSVLLTKLNTLYNTVVAPGTNVTVSSATVNYTTTYTVNTALALLSDFDDGGINLTALTPVIDPDVAITILTDGDYLIFGKVIAKQDDMSTDALDLELYPVINGSPTLDTALAYMRTTLPIIATGADQLLSINTNSPATALIAGDVVSMRYFTAEDNMSVNFRSLYIVRIA